MHGDDLRMQLPSTPLPSGERAVDELETDGWDGTVYQQASNGIRMLHEALEGRARHRIVHRLARVARLVARALSREWAA